MKNSMGKGVRLAAILCVMSLLLCACAGEKKAADSEKTQAQQSQPVSENPVVVPEPKGTGDTEGEAPASGPAGEGDLGGWDETDPDLEGDIRELEDGQFTVVESISQEAEGGGDVLIAPASGGDDSGFNKVTVTYNENTRFAIQTIYDGGARSEQSEATAKDLEEGTTIQVWGSFSEGVWEAEQICMVKVV